MRFTTPENNPAQLQKGFTRRQATTAAAWSLPVIALAVAAPAAAATDPVRNYEMGGASATGTPGEVLTGNNRPGASIRTKIDNNAVQGEAITFSYESEEDKLLFTLTGSTSVVTGIDGFAYVDATISANATPGKIGYVLASWIDTTVDPNALYTQTVAIKIV